MKSRSGKTMMLCPFAGGLLTAAVVPTAVNSPPANGHSIIVFPERDFIHADGYAANDRLTVQDLRNGVVIGTSSGIVPVDDPRTPAFDGSFDLNHLGAPCWETTTPDILPGDVIHVIREADGVTDETTTANVTVTQPATNVGGTIVMKGTAADAAGAQLAINAFQPRIIAKNLTFDVNGRRDIRATPVYDAAPATTWTATWTGLDAHDQGIAVSGESRNLWLGRAVGLSTPLGSPIESTIYEYGAFGGPGGGCFAPRARYAVTSSSPASINVASNVSDLVLSGTSQDASSVSVTLTDTVGAVATAPAVVPTPATGAQTWSVTIPALGPGGHSALAQGALTAAGSYTLTAGGVIGGATKTVLKDTFAPAAPTATPPGGNYTSSQAVALSNSAENLPMFWTVDGSPATTGSHPYTGQISITATQTLNAITVDQAGNSTAMTAQTYTIGAPPPPPPPAATVPGAPTIGASSAGVTTDTVISATARWSAPASDGGAAISSYRVVASRAGTATTVTKTFTVGTRVSPFTFKFTGLVTGASYTFTVQAVNSVGAGAASAPSSPAVVAR